MMINRRRQEISHNAWIGMSGSLKDMRLQKQVADRLLEVDLS